LPEPLFGKALERGSNRLVVRQPAVPESKRVLLVEDDALIGQQFQEAITEAGYEVLGPARSMAAGLYLAQIKPPDLAIIDIGLAGTVDGIEGGRRLRLELGLPVIFVSGRVDAETGIRAVEIGPVAFLEKLLADADPSRRSSIRVLTALHMEGGSRCRPLDSI
jgi:two-component system, response regulator PdtaR